MLVGARLVTCTETEEGSRWAETKIKLLTGGDEIQARFMRQDFFKFIPQFKLMIAGNHKPVLRAVNEAIKRRMNLLPFAVVIPPKDRDRKLTKKLEANGPSWLGRSPDARAGSTKASTRRLPSSMRPTTISLARTWSRFSSKKIARSESIS